jgi:hypothetical protein
MAISRFDVQSSFIRSIGHEGTTLHVELANGDVHRRLEIRGDVS